MKQRLALPALAVALVIVAGVCAQTRQRRPSEPAAVREIRALLDNQVKAWNQKDLEEFMKGYWQSPDLTFYSGGMKTSSWQATLDRYRKRYQSEGREMGTLEFSELEIELLGPKSAFVRGKWHLQMNAGDAGGLFTLILRKFPGGWKIIHDHTGSSTE